MNKEIQTAIETVVRHLEQQETLPVDLFHAVAKIIRLTAIEIIILKDDGGDLDDLQVLISKRSSDDPFFPNEWHLPGGIALLKDVTALDAAKRIIQKELAINPDIITLFPIRETPFFSRHLRGGESHIIFLGFWPNNTPAPNGFSFHLCEKLPRPFISHHEQIIISTLKSRSLTKKTSDPQQ